jgi:hypothetical protein
MWHARVYRGGASFSFFNFFYRSFACPNDLQPNRETSPTGLPRPVGLTWHIVYVRTGRTVGGTRPETHDGPSTPTGRGTGLRIPPAAPGERSPRRSTQSCASARSPGGHRLRPTRRPARPLMDRQARLQGGNRAYGILTQAADWGGLGVRNGAWRAAAHRDRRRRGSIEPGRSPQTLMPLLEPWLRHNHGPGGPPDCSSCGPRPAGSPWARWVAAAGRWRGLRRWCASLRVDEWVEGVLSTRRLASALSLIATSTKATTDR